MLAYILAIAVGLGSLALYLAAFFAKDIHRQDDFLWSGIGLFYALVLWVCAGRITGGVLLGQLAGVALLLWFGWENVKLRKAIANPDKQAEILSGFSPTQWLQERFGKKPVPPKTPLTEKAAQVAQETKKAVETTVEDTITQAQEVVETVVEETSTQVSEVVEPVIEATKTQVQESVETVVEKAEAIKDSPSVTEAVEATENLVEKISQPPQPQKTKSGSPLGNFLGAFRKPKAEPPQASSSSDWTKTLLEEEELLEEEIVEETSQSVTGQSSATPVETTVEVVETTVIEVVEVVEETPIETESLEEEALEEETSTEAASPEEAAIIEEQETVLAATSPVEVTDVAEADKTEESETFSETDATAQSELDEAEIEAELGDSEPELSLEAKEGKGLTTEES